VSKRKTRCSSFNTVLQKIQRRKLFLLVMLTKKGKAALSPYLTSTGICSRKVGGIKGVGNKITRKGHRKHSDLYK